jgi:hypothetical protein
MSPSANADEFMVNANSAVTSAKVFVIDFLSILYDPSVFHMKLVEGMDSKGYCLTSTWFYINKTLTRLTKDRLKIAVRFFLHTGSG